MWSRSNSPSSCTARTPTRPPHVVTLFCTARKKTPRFSPLARRVHPRPQRMPLQGRKIFRPYAPNTRVGGPFCWTLAVTFTTILIAAHLGSARQNPATRSAKSPGAHGAPYPRTCVTGCFCVGCAVCTIFLQDIGHHGDTHPAQGLLATGEAKPRDQVGGIPFLSRAWPAPTAPAVLVGGNGPCPLYLSHRNK